jgi:osmotically inducible protein OsmC
MPTRTASTHWKGGLQDGSGTVSLDSSKAGTFDVSFPKRAAEDAGGTTSPEELIGAAHSACFSMALSSVLGKAGTPPQALDTTAEVTLDTSGAAPKISSIVLRVRGQVDGASAEDFTAAAEDAKKNCPVSQALTGTTITLEASLD